MPETVTIAAEAMATRFEVALHGAPAASLRAAAEEALAEIARLEGMLSLYRPTSEIAHINSWGAQEPVAVSPEVFALLECCIELGEYVCGSTRTICQCAFMLMHMFSQNCVSPLRFH